MIFFFILNEPDEDQIFFSCFAGNIENIDSCFVDLYTGIYIYIYIFSSGLFVLQQPKAKMINIVEKTCQ